MYRVVKEHYEATMNGVEKPDPTLICGTAGSGKTFLIRALKQLLGDRCYIAAPTGVKVLHSTSFIC